MPKTLGKNKYIGKWKETDFKPIEVEYTLDNLLGLINRHDNNRNLYTDQQVAHWAEVFITKYIEMDDAENNPKLGKAIEIAEEMHMQWELFLVNKYSLQELQQLDFSKVTLPDEWYRNWQLKLAS